jgi:hypothetical protein
MIWLINVTLEQSFPLRNSTRKGLFYVVVAEGSLMRLHTNPTFQVVASKITTTKVRVVVIKRISGKQA